MKRIVALIFLTIYVLLFTVPVQASDAHHALTLDYLNSMSREEALIVLQESGLVLPQVYQEDHSLALRSINRILTSLSDNPSSLQGINYTQLRLLATEVSNLLGYDIDLITTRYSATGDSSPLGSWSESYRNYNCYSYALGITGNPHDPGDWGGFTFNPSSVVWIKNGIISDLQYMGYSTTASTTKPSSLNSGEKIICARISTDGTDYHVMRSVSSVNLWYHKPGISVPLKWNHTSPGYTTWSAEFYGNGNNWYDGGVSYSGTIWYIKYS